ncbi:cytochrome P450 [Tanacetum coccineum]
MDYSTFYLLFSLLVTLIYGFTVFNHRKSRLSPGPYPLPIIGNLLELSNKPHRSLTTLSKRYGPLMSLKLGSITTIVVSSPKMAKEFFQTHDQSFSGRSVPISAQMVNHSKHSLVFLPAGDKWRRLRRITKEYLFSAQCLDRSENLRKEKELRSDVPKVYRRPRQRLGIGRLLHSQGVKNSTSKQYFE